MLFALNMMRAHDKHERYFNSRLYSRYKQEFASAQAIRIREWYSDTNNKEALKQKRKLHWENNPEKRKEYNKKLSDKAKQQDRQNMDSSTWKLKGENRTHKQKEGSKRRREKIAGVLRSTEFINVFGVSYRTYKDAAQALKLGYEQINYLRENPNQFKTLEDYKKYKSDNRRAGA